MRVREQEVLFDNNEREENKVVFFKFEQCQSKAFNFKAKFKRQYHFSRIYAPRAKAIKNLSFIRPKKHRPEIKYKNRNKKKEKKKNLLCSVLSLTLLLLKWENLINNMTYIFFHAGHQCYVISLFSFFKLIIC